MYFYLLLALNVVSVSSLLGSNETSVQRELFLDKPWVRYYQRLYIPRHASSAERALIENLRLPRGGKDVAEMDCFKKCTNFWIFQLCKTQCEAKDCQWVSDGAHSLEWDFDEGVFEMGGEVFEVPISRSATETVSRDV
jgi:hypothetical protein